MQTLNAGIFWFFKETGRLLIGYGLAATISAITFLVFAGVYNFFSPVVPTPESPNQSIDSFQPPSDIHQPPPDKPGAVANEMLIADGGRILMLFPNSSSQNPFWQVVRLAALERAAELGVQVVSPAAVSEDIQAAIESSATSPSQWGVVVAPSDERPETLARLKDRGVTFVGLDNHPVSRLAEAAAEYVCSARTNYDGAIILKQAEAEWGSAKDILEQCDMPIKFEMLSGKSFEIQKTTEIISDVSLGKNVVLFDSTGVSSSELKQLWNKQIDDRSTFVVLGLDTAVIEGIQTGRIAASVAADPYSLGRLSMDYALNAKNSESKFGIVEPSVLIVTKGTPLDDYMLVDSNRKPITNN